MPTFTYHGTNRDGKAVKETVTATDRFAVYDIARDNGHTVDQVFDADRRSLRALLNVERINYFLSRVKDDELVMVTRNLGSMLIAGLPLSRALSVIERQSSNPKLKGIMRDVSDQINRGAQLHEALGAYPKTFSDLYVSMVRAGEEGGTLAEALHTLGTQMERSSTLKKKIKGAMI